MSFLAIEFEKKQHLVKTRGCNFGKKPNTWLSL